MQLFWFPFFKTRLFLKIMHFEMQWYFIIFGFLPYPLQIYLQETRSCQLIKWINQINEKLNKVATAKEVLWNARKHRYQMHWCFMLFFFLCLFSGWRGKQKKPIDERHGPTSITGEGGRMLIDFSCQVKRQWDDKPAVKWFYWCSCNG